MTVAIIDYGSGNLRSAAKAFERAAGEIKNGPRIVVTSDPDEVARADRIVLPGVGAFADCHSGLLALSGLLPILSRAVLEDRRPFLGICVGMQLLATNGREHGDHPGLGWIAGEVGPIEGARWGLKVPHMGWNDLTFRDDANPLLQGLENGAHAYFVHSYAFRPQNESTILATVGYGEPVVAIVNRDNIVGTQFHPEKSQKTGLRMIANFLKWRP